MDLIVSVSEYSCLVLMYIVGIHMHMNTNTAELQWFKHLWDHANLFETWEVLSFIKQWYVE